MMAKHPMHEISDYAAAHGIPTIHEHTDGVDGSGEDIEIRRLRADLAMIRANLKCWAGPYPDGTCMSDPESFDTRWAQAHGSGHPKDPGITISELSYQARMGGLEHPAVAALLEQIAAWEARLPGEFETVRAEYLDWHRQLIAVPNRMFVDWEAASR